MYNLTTLQCEANRAHGYTVQVMNSAKTLDASGTEFRARGKVVIHDGWKGIAKPIAADDENNEEAAALPELRDGQTFDNVTAAVKEGATTPPKHYTEDLLLSAMETATRAAIIEKLVKSGFIVRSKKNLLPTDKGKNLIAVLPIALTSAKLTAEWEHKLKQMERGELDGDGFMAGIATFTKAIVLDNKAPKPEFMGLFPEAKKSAAAPLGVCPRCGSPVRESMKGFFCDSRDCGFKIWRNSKFWTAKKKPLTAAIVAFLLKDGRIAVKGLYSEKAGKNLRCQMI